jgi:hypothetical protein
LALVTNFSENANVQNILFNAQQKMCNTNNWTEFEHSYNACDFPARLQKCISIQTALHDAETNYNDPYFQLYDVQSFLSQAYNFLSGGFNIGVSIFVLITNLATAIVIINARHIHTSKGLVLKKDDKLNSIEELFFTYMLANAAINAAYSLGFLLITCIKCAPKEINEKIVNVSACETSDLWVSGAMSVMKLMGNFTFLLMSINRYLLVGKDHVQWIKTVAQSNFKTKMCIAVIASGLLSLIPVYQVYFFNGLSTNDEKGDHYNSYYYYHSYLKLFEVRDSLSDFSVKLNLSLTKLSNDASALPLIFSLTILYNLFSYFLFCLFNLALDVMTVLKLKETLGEKARLSSSNKRGEQMQAERRSVIMVVLNSIVNILLRLPELLAIVFFVAVAANPNQQYPFKILCFNFGQCLTLGKISNSFDVLSLSLNVFFYYFFNKTFKFAFHLLFCGQKSNPPTKNGFI